MSKSDNDIGHRTLTEMNIATSPDSAPIAA